MSCVFWWGGWEDWALAYIPRLKTGIVPHKKGFWGAATTTPCFVSRRIITSLSCFSRKKKDFRCAQLVTSSSREDHLFTILQTLSRILFWFNFSGRGYNSLHDVFFFTLWDQNSFFQCIFSKKGFLNHPAV